MDKKEIKQALREGKLTLAEVIDAVIEINGIIGVGLISLAEDVSRHITSKIS